MRRLGATLVCALVLCAAAPPAAAASLDDLPDSVLPGPDADYGFVVEDLATGLRVAYNERRVYPSASVYKLPVAWEVLRSVDQGALSLDEPVPILDEDAVEPEPVGGVAPGESPSLREALAAMVSASSNAAAHALLRTLGRHEVNTALAENGLRNTRIPESAPAPGDTDHWAATTAEDIAHLLRTVATAQGLSQASHEELMNMLANGGPPDALRDSLPEGIDILDKTGNLEDASNVGAVLQSPRGTVLLVVLNRGVDPGEARAVIAGLGRVAYETFLDVQENMSGIPSPMIDEGMPHLLP
jgi:beta-lactamase class A